MKQVFFLLPLLLIAGCTKAPEYDLYVAFHTNGCSGFNEPSSEVKVTSEGLEIISNILSDNPCFVLDKAEAAWDGETNLTIYFTFSSESFCNQNCDGVQNLVYLVTGDELNKSGINVNVISYLDREEVSHNTIS